MNMVSVSGRMTRDPLVRVTSNGKNVANFTVAVKRPNVKETTDFIDCVAWERTADFIAEYFRKGSWIEISGVLTTRDFELADGTTKKITEVRCDIVGFGGVKKSDREAEEDAGGQRLAG